MLSRTAKIDLAIVLTVFNRPPGVLKQTLKFILDSESRKRFAIVVVDDGSDGEHRKAYQEIRKVLTSEVGRVVWEERSTVEEHPETYHIDGHNNPAYVTNIGVKLAQETGAARTLLLSSDCCIRPPGLEQALVCPADVVLVPRVVDSQTKQVFCGSHRVWPMCWFVCASTDLIASVPFDEEYLKGMAFEDNDFMGRLLLKAGQMLITDDILVVHQTHPLVAYSDDLRGFKISEEYTRKKWGGVPYGMPLDPCLTFRRERSLGNTKIFNPEAPNLCNQ